MVSAARVEELARAQEGVRVAVEQRVASTVRSLAERAGQTPVQFRNALVDQTTSIVTQFGGAAASVAAQWYEAVRLEDRVRGNFRARAAESPYGRDAVEGMVRRAVGAFFQETPDLGSVIKSVSANAGKYALGAPRETIRANSFRDPRSGGWRRVSRGDTCDFCLMLVGRGAVYREESAFFASHSRCDCAAVPSFDPSAPEVDVRLYEASQRTTGMTPAQRERHNDVIRAYLDDNRAVLRDMLPGT